MRNIREGACRLVLARVFQVSEHADEHGPACRRVALELQRSSLPGNAVDDAAGARVAYDFLCEPVGFPYVLERFAAVDDFDGGVVFDREGDAVARQRCLGEYLLVPVGVYQHGDGARGQLAVLRVQADLQRSRRRGPCDVDGNRRCVRATCAGDRVLEGQGGAAGFGDACRNGAADGGGVAVLVELYGGADAVGSRGVDGGRAVLMRGGGHLVTGFIRLNLDVVSIGLRLRLRLGLGLRLGLRLGIGFRQRLCGKAALGAEELLRCGVQQILLLLCGRFGVVGVQAAIERCLGLVACGGECLPALVRIHVVVGNRVRLVQNGGDERGGNGPVAHDAKSQRNLVAGGLARNKGAFCSHADVDGLVAYGC